MRNWTFGLTQLPAVLRAAAPVPAKDTLIQIVAITFVSGIEDGIIYVQVEMKKLTKDFADQKQRLEDDHEKQVRGFLV